MLLSRAALLLLGVGAVGCSKCDSTPPSVSGADPGQAATTASEAHDLEELEGIDLPPGTREVHREDKVGNHGDSLHTRWLASTKAPAELSRFFATASGSPDPSAREFRFDSGWVVTVAPPEPIPTTHIAPVRPVVGTAPEGLAAWIIFSRFVAPPPCPDCPPGQVRLSQSKCTCGPPPYAARSVAIPRTDILFSFCSCARDPVCEVAARRAPRRPAHHASLEGRAFVPTTLHAIAQYLQ